jgi:DNA-binding CsgD family transcriptional regulator
VLTALLEYRRPPTIAQELGLSPNTVRNHLKSIFFKLGVSSQQELLDHVRAAGEGLPRPRATALRA